MIPADENSLAPDCRCEKKAAVGISQAGIPVKSLAVLSLRFVFKHVPGRHAEIDTTVLQACELL
jgi:hypothetical protein